MVAIFHEHALYTAAPAAVERRATTTSTSTSTSSSSKATGKVKTVVTTIATTTTITGNTSTSSSSGTITSGSSSSSDSSSTAVSSSSTGGSWVSAYQALGSETLSAYKNSDGEIVSVAYVASDGSVTVVPYTSITATATSDATTTAETNTSTLATSSSQSSDSKNTSHVGVIVGVVAILVALVALGLILFFIFRYRRSRGLQPLFGGLSRSRTNITKQSRSADCHAGFEKGRAAGMAPGADIKSQTVTATRRNREKDRSLPPSPSASSVLTFPSIHDGAQGQAQMHPTPLPLAARRSMRPQLVQIAPRSPDTPPPLPSGFREHARTGSAPHVASAVAARPFTSTASSALISSARLFHSPPESDDGLLTGSSQWDGRTDSQPGSRASSHAPITASKSPSYSYIPHDIARKPVAVAKTNPQRPPHTAPGPTTASRSPLPPPSRAALRRLDGARTRVALSGLDAPASPPPMQAPPPLPPGTGVARRTSIQGLEVYGYGTPAMIKVPISRYAGRTRHDGEYW